MIDLIISHPNNCDYPLWREYLRENRKRFNKVIIVFTVANGADNYEEFVRMAMANDDVTFINSPILSGGDWRDVAVNEGLKISDSDWVYFTEQDLFTNEGFWEFVNSKIADGVDCLGAYDQTRLHPCCIFAKRSLINKTSCYFGIDSGVYDHFGKFQIEVEALTGVCPIPDNYYRHYNGYSHNWRLISEGQQPNYKPLEFKKSIEKSLSCKVPLAVQWVKTAVKYLEANL